MKQVVFFGLSAQRHLKALLNVVMHDNTCQERRALQQRTHSMGSGLQVHLTLSEAVV